MSACAQNSAARLLNELRRLGTILAVQTATALWGGPGHGSGQPSALKVRSIVTGLPAGRLTDRTIGSTIKAAKTKTATVTAAFFTDGALLRTIIRRGSFGGVL